MNEKDELPTEHRDISIPENTFLLKREKIAPIFQIIIRER